MSSPDNLGELWRGSLPDTHPAHGAKPEELRALWERVRAAHPDLRLSPARFLPFLAQRLPEEPLNRGVEVLAVEDLYLACACAGGDDAAVRTFEAEYLGQLHLAVPPSTWGRAVCEEVAGRLRQRLLAGDESGGPRILDYEGRAKLWRWLRVIALREAIQIRRRDRKRVPAAEQMFERVPVDEADPELAYLKAKYRSDFRAVFQEALGSLGARERNLLRHYYLDGLTIDQLAELYRVHRATAARRLQSVRDQLLTATRKGFRARLQVGREEFDSILRLIESQLDVSIHRYLEDVGE